METFESEYRTLLLWLGKERDTINKKHFETNYLALDSQEGHDLTVEYRRRLRELKQKYGRE